MGFNPISTLFLLCALGIVNKIIAKEFSLVLVGGGLEDDNFDVWNTIIELGGGKNIAKFGVISAASENPCCDEDSSWIYYEHILLSYGAAEVYYIPVTTETSGNNTDPEVVATIKKMTGFFFGGGDQTRIVRSFYNGDDKVVSPALIAIKEAVIESGGVIAGTSAGTDCQTSNIMITGGISYQALRDGSFPHWQALPNPNPNILGAYGPGGIGNFPFGLLDTHFENRGRQGRLLRLLSDTMGYPSGNKMAFGVDENTALVITYESEPVSSSCPSAAVHSSYTRPVGRIIGQRGVVVIDVRDAIVLTEGGHWGIENVRMSHLTAQDKIDLLSYAMTPAAYKTPLAGNEHYEFATTSNNIFEEGTFAFNSVATSLFNSRMQNSTFGLTESLKTPRFIVKMGKFSEYEADQGSDIQGYGFEGTDPNSGEYSISYINLHVSVSALQESQ